MTTIDRDAHDYTGAKAMAATMMTHRMLTPTEAAEYLGIKAQTLAVWRSTGRHAIPFVKVGVHIRYRQSDLDAWIASRTVTPKAVD